MRVFRSFVHVAERNIKGRVAARVKYPVERFAYNFARLVCPADKFIPVCDNGIIIAFMPEIKMVRLAVIRDHGYGGKGRRPDPPTAPLVQNRFCMQIAERMRALSL